MPSLADCFKIHGITKIEQDMILAKIDGYKADGVSGQNANIRAIKDAINELEGERADILGQIENFVGKPENREPTPENREPKTENREPKTEKQHENDYEKAWNHDLTPEGRRQMSRAIGWSDRDTERISKTTWRNLSPASQRLIQKRIDELNPKAEESKTEIKSDKENRDAEKLWNSLSPDGKANAFMSVGWRYPSSVNEARKKKWNELDGSTRRILNQEKDKWADNEKSESGDKVIGVNVEGNKVYEKPDGHRYYVENGIASYAPRNVTPRGKEPPPSAIDLFNKGRYDFLSESELNGFRKPAEPQPKSSVDSTIDDLLKLSAKKAKEKAAEEEKPSEPKQATTTTKKDEEFVEFEVQPLAGGPKQILMVPKTPARHEYEHAQKRTEVSNKFNEGKAQVTDAAKRFNELFGEKGEIGIGEKVDPDKWKQAHAILKDMFDGFKKMAASVREAAELFIDQAYAMLSSKGRPYIDKFIQEDIRAALTGEISGGKINQEIQPSPEGGKDVRTIRNDTEGVHGGQPPETVQTDEEGRDAERVPGGQSESGDKTEAGTRGESGDEGQHGGRDRDKRPHDYSITAKDKLGKGGPKQKYRDNIAAIRLLSELKDRQAAPEEQEVLVKYVGWGGIPQAFPRPDGSFANGWESEAKELESLLTPQDYAAARRSTQDAHYTSQTVVEGIYEALKRLGFTGGKILEPSAGTGNFIGLMPKSIRSGSKITAVELDPITSSIAKQLYPDQNVVSMGFESVFLAPDSYDLAIGNPPFGDQTLFDPNNTDLKKFTIHNFFFAKSLKSLRPNGILAMVVSSSMMDKIGSAQREWMNERAELIGAVRLPNNAFKENAGTEVTTDIVFLRKREEGEAKTSPAWMNVKVVPGVENKWRINEYFADNPQMMLGELAPNKLHPGEIVDGLYDAVPGLVSKGEFDKSFILNAIGNLPEKIYRIGKTVEEVQNPDVIVSDIGFAQPYGYTIDYKGQAVRRLPDVNGEQRYEVVAYGDKPLAGARLDRFKGLMKVRDAVRRLIRAEVADDPKMKKYRKNLNKTYDSFVEKFGYLSADINGQVLKDDPVDLPLLRSLETDYDKGVSLATAKSTGQKKRNPSAKKSSIFTERTRQPYKEAKTAENSKDALAITLRERGVIDIDHMSKLTGKTTKDVAAELKGIIFKNPETDRWETAEYYLSGNVKEKLKIAQKSGARDNIEALMEVQPKDVPPDLISFHIGASWFPLNLYERFASEALNSDVSINYLDQSGVWVAKTNDYGNSEYTTPHIHAADIFIKMIQSKDLSIYKTDEDGKRYLDREATTAAIQNGVRMDRAFQQWVLSDADRRDLLAKAFNDKVNTTVDPKFDGSHMVFPGMGVITAGVDRNDQLMTHQKNAVWRLIQKGKGLLDHVVGAGKTFIAISTGMEMKRMGLLKKPMFVVPNHLVQQWTSDFQKLYPGANVLAIGKKDFARSRRQEFLARIATGNWDAVLIAHSSFGFIKMPYEYESQFYQEQLNQYEVAIRELSAQEGKASRTVKQLEKSKDKLRAKMAERASKPKENVVDFSELGVDGLFVDEAHEFKNLFFVTKRTKVPLGNPEGAQKSFELFIKTQYLQDNNNGRGVFFLTGTPVSNSISEMYTMMRYLDYAHLKDLGITHFDQWANMFTSAESDWEVDPTGTRYRLQTKLEFVNLPGLMSFYKDFADVVSTDDLKAIAEKEGKVWPIPKIKGGKPENVVAKRSDLQKNFMEYIVYRFDNMPPDPRIDNPLKATGEAMKAALDIRLIREDLPDFAGSKTNTAVKNVVNTYKKWDGKKGTQLVFCDLSVPKKHRGKHVEEIRSLREEIKSLEAQMEKETDRDILLEIEEKYTKAIEEFEKFTPAELMAADSNFSVYDDIKSKLIATGIPEAEIAFIHDANTDKQKADLFAKVRSGAVRVLIGSTSKMGAGMNVQDRLVALHHMDAPWRPSDLEQREGRIIRQGNKFFEADPKFEVEIYRYSTKETLDTRRWQIIERKARTIAQLRAGDHAWGEKIEDTVGEAASAAEMKAASSGNPLVLEEIQTRKNIDKAEALQKFEMGVRYRNESILRQAMAFIKNYPNTVSDIEKDLAFLRQHPKDPSEKGWEIKIGDIELKPKDQTKEALEEVKKEYGKVLREAMEPYMKAGLDTKIAITYRGVKWIVQSSDHYIYLNPDIKSIYRDISLDKKDGISPHGLMVRMDNILDDFVNQVAEQDIRSLGRDLLKEKEKEKFAKEQLAKTDTDYEPEIKRLRDRHAAIINELQNDVGARTHTDIADFSMWTGGRHTAPGGGVDASINDQAADDKTYYRKIGKEFEAVPSGRKIDVVDWFETFSYKDKESGYWHVVEAKSGLAISVLGDGSVTKWETKIEALNQTIKNIETFGRERIEGLISDAISREGGRSPWGQRESYSIGQTKPKSTDKMRPVDTESAAFLKWFGKSKVVDDDGKPLRVFHGTRQIFDSFSKNKRYKNYEFAKGFFFTSNRDEAEFFTNEYDNDGLKLKGDSPRVIDAYLSIQNPLIINVSGSVVNYFDLNQNEILSTAKRKKHDGIIVKSKDKNSIDLYVAFKPTQIKSAISNTGAFSDTDPRIQYSVEEPKTFKSLTPADIATIYNKRGQKAVIEDDGSITVTQKKGSILKINTVDQIDIDKVRFEVSYKRKLQPDDVAFGKYDNGTITLVEGKAGIFTLFHEDMHHFIQSGMLNKRDVRILERKAEQRGLGTSEEALADMVSGDMLKRREERDTPYGRVLQKIKDIIDQFVNLFNKTYRGTLRDIESGKVYGKGEKLDTMQGMATESYSVERARGDKYAVANPQLIRQTREARESINRDTLSVIEKGMAILGKKHPLKPKKADLSFANDLMVSLPSFFAKGEKAIPAVESTYNAAQDRQDEKHEMVYDLEHPEVRAGGINGLTNTVEAMKNLPKTAYEKIRKYLVDTDRYETWYKIKDVEDIGWSVIDRDGHTVLFNAANEFEAVEKAREFEANDLADKGYTPEQIHAVMAFRTTTDKMFEIYMASMRKIIADAETGLIEMPKIRVVKEGKPVHVDLKTAMAMMGDIRGGYYPRIREEGKYVMVAEKEGEFSILEKFNVRSLKEPRVRELERQGYKVTVAESDKMGEDVFSLAGGLIKTQQLVNAAMDKIERKAKQNGLSKEDLKDFESDFENLFATSVAEQVANVIRERGARAHMTRRSEKIYLGYEEDAITAISKAIRGVAGAESKKNMILKMLRAVTGTEISFNEFKSIQAYDRGFEAYRDENPDVKVSEKVFNKYNDPEKVNADNDAISDARAMLKTEKDKDARAAIKKTIKDLGGYPYEKYRELVREMMIYQPEQKNAFKWAMAFIDENSRNLEFGDKVIGALRGAAVGKYLAFRVFSAPLINLSALPTSTIATLKALGIPYHKTWIELGEAIARYGRYRAGSNKLSAEDKWIFDHISHRGWDDAQYSSEAMDVLKSTLGRGYDNVIKWGMFTFSESERLNRASTIAAAYKGILKLEKYAGKSQEELADIAKKASDDSHGVYNKGNLPYIALGRNPAAHVARMFTVFTRWSHTYLMNMKRMGFEEKDYIALAHMAIAPAVLAGAGASILTPLIATLLKAFGVDEPEEEAYQKISEMFGPGAENFSRFGISGLFGRGPGISVKSSVAIGAGGIPTSLKDAFGAPGSVLSDIFIDGIPAIASGNVSKGVEKILPTGLGNIFRAYREYTDGVTNRGNAPLFYGTEPVKLDTTEWLLRTFSFYPARVAKIRDQQWSEYQTKERFDDRRNKIYARFKKWYFTDPGNRDPETFADLLAEVEVFNKKAEKSRAYISPITKKSIRANIKRASKPSKRERLRRIAQ